ncbi:MAG: transporter related protein [Chloroflexi bacterium]|nr:transporter related protein [Chloroflexota bacterium]
MSDIAIRVEGLGKKYRLGASLARYKTIRESMTGLAMAPLRRARALAGRRPGEGERGYLPEFWALRDVSFDVQHGEVLGIIGRNGSGKSTLLKLLSHITEPTAGRIGINGRVASLLEVGTGFHPELTGRENVYLNGAILGMSRAEITRKFDEIVAFAEVEKFIDTQVKHYSSGMYLRLAFAVAAHLEPEILIVDEVLAVGDAAFQRRCIGKMEEVSRKGRTVLFVSHSMGAIQALCSKTMLLQHGNLIDEGATNEVIARYTSLVPSDSYKDQLAGSSRRGHGRVRITDFTVEDTDGRLAPEIISGKDYYLKLAYESDRNETLRNCRIAITVNDRLEQYLFTCSTEQFAQDELKLPPKGYVRIFIPRFPLSGGQYYFVLFFEVNREVEDWHLPGLVVSVIDAQFFPGIRQYPDGAAGRGVLVSHTWKLPDLHQGSIDDRMHVLEAPS